MATEEASRKPASAPNKISARPLALLDKGSGSLNRHRLARSGGGTMPLLKRSYWRLNGFRFKRRLGRAHAHKSFGSFAGPCHNRIDNVSNPAQSSRNRPPSRSLDWRDNFDRSPELLNPLLFFVCQANPPVLV